MSDTSLNKFITYGTNADRLAFTPNPPAATNILYFWFETDTGLLYKYDTSWSLVTDQSTIGQVLNVQTSYLVSGGQIIWTSAYNFTITTADYFIQGVEYTSPQTNVTLSAADPTNDRIDVIAVNSSGAVVVITGTAAAQPSEPIIDPATQLKLGIVTVTHGTTQPVTAVSQQIYLDDAGGPSEWNATVSGTSIVANSLNNPLPPATHDIEVSTAVAGDYIKLVKPSGTQSLINYDNFILYIRSKATWAKGRGLSITLRLSGAIVGQAVNINPSGSFGFSSSTTGSYQAVSIPFTAFAIPAGTNINEVRITAFGAGHGCYIANIQLQISGTTQIVTGLTQTQADARYIQLTQDVVTVGADAATLPNSRQLAAGTSISLDTSVANVLTINALGGTSRSYWPYKVNTGATSGYPGDKYLLWDNATQTSATNLIFAHITNDTTDIDLLLALISNGDEIILQDQDASANFQKWKVSGTPTNTNPGAANSYWTVPVTLVSSGGTGTTGFSNNHQLIAVWSQTVIGSILTRGFTVDGGGSVPSTGIIGSITWQQRAATIVAIRIFSGNTLSGNAVVDIWKANAAWPTVANTIINTGAGGVKPTLSASDYSSDTTLAHYTISVATGDRFRFNLDSVATLTQITVEIDFRLS